MSKIDYSFGGSIEMSKTGYSLGGIIHCLTHQKKKKKTIDGSFQQKMKLEKMNDKTESYINHTS